VKFGLLFIIIWQGFHKGLAMGRLAGCEDYFAKGWFDHVEENFSDL